MVMIIGVASSILFVFCIIGIGCCIYNQAKYNERVAQVEKFELDQDDSDNVIDMTGKQTRPSARSRNKGSVKTPSSKPIQESDDGIEEFIQSHKDVPRDK